MNNTEFKEFKEELKTSMDQINSLFEKHKIEDVKKNMQFVLMENKLIVMFFPEIVSAD